MRGKARHLSTFHHSIFHLWKSGMHPARLGITNYHRLASAIHTVGADTHKLQLRYSTVPAVANGGHRREW